MKLPSNKNFGIVFCIVFLIVAIYPLINNSEIRIWSIILALIFLILGLINSQFLTPLNRVWFKFGIFLGKFVSPVAMGLVFFLVVTPTGMIMKLLKKDILKLKNNNNKSYWIERSENKTSMKNQF